MRACTRTGQPRKCHARANEHRSGCGRLHHRFGAVPESVERVIVPDHGSANLSKQPDPDAAAVGWKPGDSLTGGESEFLVEEMGIALRRADSQRISRHASHRSPGESNIGTGKLATPRGRYQLR